MHDLMGALKRNASAYDGATAIDDDKNSLTRAGLAARVAGFAEELRPLPATLGLIGENGVEWTIAQLAGWLAGKIIVPIPAFFSAEQQGHILSDSGATQIIATSQWSEPALKLGAPVVPVSLARCAQFPDPTPGGGQIIYTSGSTGRPKGVRLELGQIEQSASMLAQATDATKSDVYLSVLPLPLLLETICAICVPILVGASVEFDPALTAAVTRGQPQGIATAFARHRPTTSVLVPELLAAWVGELAATRTRAPTGLRFVATGGAPVSATLAEKAWSLGIPLHEGYGLSECCSVVSVNRPGNRKPGTVGQPLPGLRVEIDDGEIVVDGPTVMAGYQNRGPAQRPWRTGDLGSLDGDGYLTIAGRKDNLIVTSYGRNVSPEWIEALLATDGRIAACAILGHGEPHLHAFIIPSAAGAAWFARAPKAHVLLAIAAACSEAPSYAVPRDYVVVDRAEAASRNLLTPNGRFRRALLAKAFADIRSEATPAGCTFQRGDDRMSFYDDLQAATAADRAAYLSIPLIQEAVRNGASRALYVDFLTQAYHHVKHTYPLLALASVHTTDEAYQDALVEYMKEERGHEKWILDDIRALGADAEAVRTGKPGRACQIMVGYTYYAIQWISPYAMLGSVHVLEGMSTVLADKAAEAIQRSLALSGGDGFSYLRSHGALDIEHVAFFKELANALPHSAHGIVIETSQIIYRLYGDIFRELAMRHPGRRDAA